VLLVLLLLWRGRNKGKVTTGYNDVTRADGVVDCSWCINIMGCRKADTTPLLLLPL
jgi:hypothetical protein